MHLVACYLVVVGSFTATAQALRGVVRGAGKLIEGKPREAVAEVAGGLLAPARSVYNQACCLGEDVFRVAATLSFAEDEPEGLPEPATQRRPAILHPIVDEAVSG
jgi:hypothetical protein